MALVNHLIDKKATYLRRCFCLHCATLTALVPNFIEWALNKSPIST